MQKPVVKKLLGSDAWIDQCEIQRNAIPENLETFNGINYADLSHDTRDESLFCLILANWHKLTFYGLK
jgi:hypothetical protein